MQQPIVKDFHHMRSMHLIMEPILSAKVTAKIRSLYDCQMRLANNIQPVPSGVDIANTVKYFSQTLLSVLKDVPNSPLEMLKDPQCDIARMSLYPNLDYKGLYNAISQLIDASPNIQFGMIQFGEAVLQCLGCLLPFLEYDQIDNLPYLAANCVSVLPESLHQEVVNLLCFYVLPSTITRHYEGDEEESQASQSVAAVIMMVFQHSNSPALHFQLLECLMRLKPSVVKDVLCVIAFGTTPARASAAKLLFYIWPPFDTNLFDRKGLLCKFAERESSFRCRREACPQGGTAEAVKVCLDHSTSVQAAPDSPPPLYLCIECANELHREKPKLAFLDILHPMQHVSMVCENKNCRSTDKSAYSICFSIECANFNGYHPIRYCQQCHGNRHNSRRGGDHVVHKRLSQAWLMDSDMQTNLVEAIVSLLKEAAPPNAEDGDVEDRQQDDTLSIEERQLLGRYGVWLLVGLCMPGPSAVPDILARLISALQHWFHVTKTAYTGETQNAVERLKWDHAVNWLKSVGGALLPCLTPRPPDCARVAGHWDKLATHTHRHKHGLHRLYCLIPYGIITQQIWSNIMPHWMEAINEVPDYELDQLKDIVGKILDPESNMTGLDERKMYSFAAVRFHKTSPSVQLQALNWLQKLSFVEVIIPLAQLYEMFTEGVQAICAGDKGTFKAERLVEEDKSDSDLSNDDEDEGDGDMESEAGKDKDSDTPQSALTCCVLMLDVLLKQMELQKRRLANLNVSSESTKLLRLMLTACPMKCSEPEDCDSTECLYCEIAGMWHQLAVMLVKSIDKQHEASAPVCNIQPQVPPHDETFTGVGGVLVHMPHIMTATVETITEQLDMAVSMPSEINLLSAVDNTPIQVSQLKAMQSKLLEECDSDNSDDFQPVNSLEIDLEQLPNELHYLHQLLLEMGNGRQVYYVLQVVHTLCVGRGLLAIAAQEHRNYFRWCQENLLIKNIWSVCEARRSHICSLAVPVLLQCVTLPGGADVLWRLVQHDFHHKDWRLRFHALERLTLITRFMDSTPLKNNIPLQTALATAFCYLISSMDDISVHVAQRATLYIATLHDNAIKALISCLETQFDLVIVDRPMVLQSLYQLHNALSDRDIFTWDFFLNRFETLILEAHINNSIDINNLRDLLVSECGVEALSVKLKRAAEALAAAGNEPATRTLSGSLGTKWPYKRTISAPASVHRQVSERDKVYSRQYSAPILKRKSSKLSGIGGGTSIPKSSYPDPQVEEHAGGLSTFEEANRQTENLLVYLLMQFMSRMPHTQQSLKCQPAVLRHLFLLMGYDTHDKTFHMAPHDLRESPVFNAFLSSLPQVLDQNHEIGRLILEPSWRILLTAPGSTVCSLRLLEPRARNNWLLAVIVLLYKYEYSQQPMCGLVQTIIKTILLTIEGQFHVCKRIPPTLLRPHHITRSRDHSQPSLTGVNNDPNEPPQSPSGTLSDSKKNRQGSYHKSPAPLMRGHWVTESLESSSGNVKRRLPSQESSESELIAIPETSDKSDTTFHGSTAPGSFDDPSHCEEMLVPLKPEVLSPVQMQTIDTKLSARRVSEGGPRQVLSGLKLGGGDSSGSGTEKSITSPRPHDSFSSDESHLKSTPLSNQSNDKWPEHGTSHLTGKQRKIFAGGSSPDTVASSNSESHFSHWPQNKSPTLKSPASLAASGPYESPESPLSRMRVHENEPPSMAECDRQQQLNIDLGSAPRQPLHVPAQERLLPIGPQPLKEQYPVFNALVDRVREALNIPREDSTDRTDSSKSEGDIDTNRVPKPKHTTDEKRPPRTPRPSTETESGWWSGERIVKPKKGEEVPHRCTECGAIHEQYNDEELGLCVVALATLIHREPAIAAPMLPDILHRMTSVARGAACGVSLQLTRTSLHHLAPHNVFMLLFQINTPEKERSAFFKSIAQAFVDFNELYPCGPLQLLAEHLNSRKTLPIDAIPTICLNMYSYTEWLAPEALGPPSALSVLLAHMDGLLRNIALSLPQLSDIQPLLKLMTSLLKIPQINQNKSILEPFCKIMSFAMENTILKYSMVSELNYLCHKAFTKERDKLTFCRIIIFQLIQALKTKLTIPDQNLFLALHFILQDVGGSSCMLSGNGAGPIWDEANECGSRSTEWFREGSAGASEVMRAHLHDVIDFILDTNALHRLKGSASKSLVVRSSVCLNEDTLGAGVKGALGAWLAAELSRAPRDPRALHRLLPAAPAGTREISEVVNHVRLLSWLLVGALSYPSPPQPIPPDATCHIADYIQVIVTSLVDQVGRTASSRVSQLLWALSGHALWALYLERHCQSHSHIDSRTQLNNSLADYCCKLTPHILQLKNTLADAVNLHFLSLMEILSDYNSTVLHRMLPLWEPILHTPSTKMSAHVEARMRACEIGNSPTNKPLTPPLAEMDYNNQDDDSLCNNAWRLGLPLRIHRLTLHLAQLEMQPSDHTHFYCV